MIADPLVVNNGTSSVTYNRISQAGNASMYARTTNVAGDAQTVKVTHSVRNASGNNTALKADQHYVSIALQQTNADGVSLETASVGLSIVVPRSGTISRAEVDTLLCTIANFIAGSAAVTSTGAATITKLLLGES